MQDVDIYAALIAYADAYTCKLPDSQIKDRNACLKKVERAILVQSRMADALLRELPFDYRETTGAKIEQMKKNRLRAINDLLGDGKTIKTSDE